MVSILTSPRPAGLCYLGPTLEALTPQLGSGTESIVFANGYRPEIPAAWTLGTAHPEPLGTRRMMWEVLRVFVHSKLDRLLYCEDDILPCQNLISLCHRLELPDAWPVVSFFDPRIPLSAAPRLIRLPMKFFIYTQACLLPRRTALELAGADFSPHRKWGKHRGDLFLRHHLLALGYREYGLTDPQLIRHQGETSAITQGPSPARHNPAFAGADFNALQFLDCRPAIERAK